MATKTAAKPQSKYARINVQQTRARVITNLLHKTSIHIHKPSAELLKQMGITTKRYNALMTGKEEWLLCEAIAYCRAMNLKLEEHVSFNPAKN